jgi:hypothetical protein
MKCFVLSNMHIPSAEGNFKEGGKAVKSLIIKDYTTHMGYVDRMANSYSISKKTWKSTKNLSSIHTFCTSLVGEI